MNLKTLLVCALLVGCLSIGFATADTGVSASTTQTIPATALPWEASITAPIEIPTWVLQRGVDNENYIGTVKISSDAPATWDMTLTVTPTTTNWVAVSTEQPLTIFGSSGWTDLVDGTLLKEANSPNNLGTKVDVPIYLRQVITDQAAGDYSLVLTYSLTVTNPG